MGVDVGFGKAKDPPEPAFLVVGLDACVVTAPAVAEVEPHEEGGEGEGRDGKRGHGVTSLGRVLAIRYPTNDRRLLEQ